MFDSPPEMPMASGDVVGKGFRACRHNIPVIFRILLVPTIIFTIAGVVAQWGLTYGLAAMTESKDIVSSLLLIALGFVGILAAMVSSWIMTIRLLALVRILLGFSPDYIHAMKVMDQRKWGIIGLYFVGTVVFGVVLGFWFFEMVISAVVGANIPSSSGKVVFTSLGMIFGMVGIFATVILYMIAGLVAMPILACEDEHLMGVIGRSLQLTFKYFWRSLGFGFLLFLTYTVVTYPLSLPVVALTIFDMTRHGLMSPDGLSATYKAPLYVMVVNQLWESLLGLIMRPSVLFAFGLFYFDLRLRSEGLDIRRKVEKLKRALVEH